MSNRGSGVFRSPFSLYIMSICWILADLIHIIAPSRQKNKLFFPTKPKRKHRSAASSEMRQLERERQRLDAEAIDVENALAIREGTSRGGASLLGRRYADAARAVSDVNAIRDGRGGGRGMRLVAGRRARDIR